MRTLLPPFLLLFLTPLLASCTKTPFSSNALDPVVERRYYVIDRSVITHLEMMRQFPGEIAWTVKMERTGDSKDSSWKITAAPRLLGDDLADESFIAHFLDTLETFTPSEEAPKGDLASYGLDAPRARIRWNSTASNSNFQLDFGNETHSAARFVLYAPDTKVMISSGAALSMLSYMKDWERLRHQVWVLGASDDIDWIIPSSGSAPLEREGNDWKLQTHSKTISKIAPALENLTHQRIKRFVDSTDETATLDAKFKSMPGRVLILKNRKNEEQKLTLYSWDEKRFGKNSLRKDKDQEAWVELYPEIDQTWSDFTQATSTPVKSRTK